MQRIIERTQVPNSYQPTFRRYESGMWAELRGRGGCWCIVTYVGEFSCTVRTWNRELTVGVQYLKSYDYLPAECEQMQSLCDRISRVYSSRLEESVQRFLESLEKPKRAYLTDLEEKVLKVLELEILPECNKETML
ncbi:hypothetical protein [Nostoc sp. CHAB 5715]|uniref:hypothetical protein n=1 Tax=Nostoc sp. CHAB 5715 TaxID=2780400 RepID=UPI001E5030D3|nr:hypothetical protein [Nostoc sp. CHAB 5715]MCC5623907.1 hypothetical protein [Nostoc sp. CHAB 5715]